MDMVNLSKIPLAKNRLKMINFYSITTPETSIEIARRIIYFVPIAIQPQFTCQANTTQINLFAWLENILHFLRSNEGESWENESRQIRMTHLKL